MSKNDILQMLSRRQSRNGRLRVDVHPYASATQQAELRLGSVSGCAPLLPCCAAAGQTGWSARVRNSSTILRVVWNFLLQNGIICDAHYALMLYQALSSQDS